MFRHRAEQSHRLDNTGDLDGNICKPIIDHLEMSDLGRWFLIAGDPES
jgi:hypothetical protein